MGALYGDSAQGALRKATDLTCGSHPPPRGRSQRATARRLKGNRPSVGHRIVAAIVTLGGLLACVPGVAQAQSPACAGGLLPYTVVPRGFNPSVAAIHGRWSFHR